ncbi:hypothetical protein EJ08DRAFT_692106 [Tothia fuscella]|uniref:Uncharacterized protein n=1 Tax=Tothia fuscella TaxID=1048955 RepID=A0A9P4P453_9PEZI|nr:hypothetical protein EJ08DRAFT_692106 [Tothia fuscella]
MAAPVVAVAPALNGVQPNPNPPAQLPLNITYWQNFENLVFNPGPNQPNLMPIFNRTSNQPYLLVFDLPTNTAVPAGAPVPFNGLYGISGPHAHPSGHVTMELGVFLGFQLIEDRWAVQPCRNANVWALVYGKLRAPERRKKVNPYLNARQLQRLRAYPRRATKTDRLIQQATILGQNWTNLPFHTTGAHTFFDPPRLGNIGSTDLAPQIPINAIARRVLPMHKEQMVTNYVRQRIQEHNSTATSAGDEHRVNLIHLNALRAHHNEAPF